MQDPKPVPQVFYVEEVPSKRLTCIDFAVDNGHGTLVSQINRKTQAELSEERCCEVRLTDQDTFIGLQEAYYTTEPVRITECDFNTALECLPPMRWGFHEGLESFRMTEFYSGRITSIYARQPDGTCWSFKGNAFMSAQELFLKIQKAASSAPLAA